MYTHLSPPTPLSPLSPLSPKRPLAHHHRTQYSGIIVPMQLAFFNDFNSPEWNSLNLVVDVFFIMDIAINFRTGRPLTLPSLLSPYPRSSLLLSFTRNQLPHRQGGPLT